jgi:signal transduction histidine kinase/ActR/RegA family two-component response regulator
VGLDQRVLVLAPTGKDAALARSVLERAGIACDCFKDLEHVCAELDQGAGALILVEEAVVDGRGAILVRWQKRQPSWSDLPVLVLARPGADSTAVTEAMELMGNVTVLERPTRVSALVSTARSALRARARQYQIRDELAARERAEAALRDADRRKDEFLAILAHELRNPLAPISNALHILRQSGPLDPTVERFGAMMQRQVHAMVRLVDDLLEVSRITRGKIELRKELLDVGAVVRGAVEMSRPLIDAAAHQLDVSVPPEPAVVEGDPMRLAQVLSNLLNNAARYTESGGRIWLRVRREGSAALISVRDTGLGIPAEMLSRVFDSFVQIGREGKHTPGGLGIGLTLVKHLVELHGGSVEATSEGPGRGSEFVVRLPLSERSLDELDAREKKLADVLGPRRILVVDDNRDAAESLAILLGQLGARVRVAYSGTEALAEVASYEPEVILLDIGMSDMDGYEVARRIRKEHTRSGVILIAVTGWGQEDDRRQSRSAGFDYHLTKPAGVDELQRLLLSLDGIRSESSPGQRDRP